MKKLFILTAIVALFFTGFVFAGDKLVTTMSGLPYYIVADEDTMSSNSDEAVPTQQSVKAYVDTTTATELADDPYYLTVKITDISTKGSTYVVVPDGGEITFINTILSNAISVADANLEFQLLNVAMTDSDGDGSLIVANSGSAAGSIFNFTPTALNVIGDGSGFEISTDGGSTTACEATVTITVDP